MKIIYNIKYVLSRRNYIVFLILGFLFFLFLGFYFFNYQLSIGNLGYLWTYIDIISHIMISFLFALFLAGQIYKIRHIGKIDAKTTWTWIFWSFFGIIITGCPSCSITLASYLGLASFLSFFPWGGLELKIVSVIILFIVNYSLYKNLFVCKIKKY